MSAAPAVQPDDVGPFALPLPVFTLGSALAWLGHACRGRCSTPLADVDATVWFVLGGPPRLARLASRVVVVELATGAGSQAADRRVLRAVNGCAVTDGIHVRPRHGVDDGRALAVVTSASGARRQRGFRYEFVTAAEEPRDSGEVRAARGPA